MGKNLGKMAHRRSPQSSPRKCKQFQRLYLANKYLQKRFGCVSTVFRLDVLNNKKTPFPSVVAGHGPRLFLTHGKSPLKCHVTSFSPLTSSLSPDPAVRRIKSEPNKNKEITCKQNIPNNPGILDEIKPAVSTHSKPTKH